jgi:hypothetical protein
MRVGIGSEFNVITHAFAHGAYDFNIPLHAIRAVHGRNAEALLQNTKALLHVTAGLLGERIHILERVKPAAIGGHAVANLPIEHVVNGLLQQFALQIPARDVDGAQCG